MTTTTTKAENPKTAVTTPGDNRSAEDLDGNKAGARGGNRAPGPSEPETEGEPKDKPREPRS
jgi:hypothetical protein